MSKDKVEKFIKAIDKEDINSVINIIRFSAILDPDNGISRYKFLRDNVDDKNDNHEASNSSLNIIRILLHEPTKEFMVKMFRQVLEISQLDIALFLLEEVPRKIDVNAYDADGQTALHAACKSGAIETVKFLLKHGADIHAKSTKLTRSACPNDIHEDDEDWDNVYGKTALHFAARFRYDYTLIQILLSSGADIHATDDGGSTCLHFVGYCCYPLYNNFVFLLLDAGADCNAKNSFGRTPLHRAAKLEDMVSYLEVLLRYGGDVNVTCNDSLTPLDYAASDSRQLRSHEDVLIKHIIAMKALDLHVSEHNLKYIDLAGKHRNIFKACKEELAIMKNTKIGESKVTFYDLLTASITQLAVYGQDVNLFTELRDIFYKKRNGVYQNRGIYPYYNNMIAARIKELMDLVKKKELINSSLKRLEIALVGLFGKALPQNVASQVIECYTETELKNSSKASASNN